MYDHNISTEANLVKMGYSKQTEKVRLKCGVMSDEYINLREPLAYHNILSTVVHRFVEKIRGNGWYPDNIGCVAVGGIPLAVALSHELQTSYFYVRPEKKDHGIANNVDGVLPDKDAKVLLVEDVVTTGGSIMLAYDAISDITQDIKIMSVVDRGDVEKMPLFKLHEERYSHLYTLEQIRMLHDKHTYYNNPS